MGKYFLNNNYEIIIALVSVFLTVFLFIAFNVVKRRKKIEQDLSIRLEQLNILNENLMEEIRMRKEAEEKLIKYTVELKNINAAKDRFYSVISHDLKNPFQGLLSYADLLYEEFDSLPDDTKKEIVKGIRNQSKKIYELLINLLEWTKLQSDKIIIEPIKINLRNKVNEILNLHGASATIKNIKLKNEIDSNAIIFVDEYILNTVLNNLISNAIKFTEEGGTVTINSLFSSDGVEITVQDTGIGISSDDIQKLFKPDTHFSTKGTYSESGTGLGLLLCKEMIEKHGGNISVESKLNEGSIFKVFFPKK
ncbi:MAG: HAMP domain-containing sensor histidine kinase [Melioribacter sp.]|uniref:sensor histidine kinase n=1 Tax=Rosettibacter primus TaxID=3111523 RepID=UPI00247CC4EE|nr:HAMP domain-containing sensor histidine kinase [Melioribacter sp.]